MATWKKIALEEQIGVINTDGTPSLATGVTEGEMQSLIGVDPAGTDNSTNVTVAGSLDYITLNGQELTRNAIDLTTDVTGTLPVANGGTGATTLTANGVLIGNGTDAVSAVALTAKGSLLTGDGAGNPSVLAAGTDDYVLVADSTTASGLNYVSIGSISGSGTVIDVTGGTNINIGGTSTTEPVVNLDASITGMTGIDFTAASASIAASIGANTLTLGGSTSTVSIAGNLEVQGTTTTINSTIVEVTDQLIKLANVADPTVSTANGSGIQVEASATEAEWPEVKWNNGGALSGWTVANYTETTNADLPVSVMSHAAGAPSASVAGVGSFYYDTTNNALYLQTGA
jgi:hypothetical protein